MLVLHRPKELARTRVALMLRVHAYVFDMVLATIQQHIPNCKGGEQPQELTLPPNATMF